MEINNEIFEEMLSYLTGDTITKMIKDLEQSFKEEWPDEDSTPSLKLAKVLDFLRDYFTKVFVE